MNRHKITFQSLKSLIFILCISTAGAITAEEAWMDGYEWVLEKVEPGHADSQSEAAVATGNMTVESNAGKYPTGNVVITSKGFGDDSDCEETYTFSWELGNYHHLKLIDNLHVEIEAKMESTLGENVKCPGSQDGTFVAAGTVNSNKPIFLPKEYWFPPGYTQPIGAIKTDGGAGPVWGWREPINVYPRKADGNVVFLESFVPEENYPDYASFQLLSVVSSNVAPGQLSYSVVYTYKRKVPPEPVDPDGSLFPVFNYLIGKPGGAPD